MRVAREGGRKINKLYLFAHRREASGVQKLRSEELRPNRYDSTAGTAAGIAEMTFAPFAGESR